MRSPTGQVQGVSKPGNTVHGEETLFQELESLRREELGLCLQALVPVYKGRHATHKESARFTNGFPNQEC